MKKDFVVLTRIFLQVASKNGEQKKTQQSTLGLFFSKLTSILSEGFAYIEVYHMCSGHRGEKRVLDTLEKEFQVAENHCVGAKNWVRILCKSSKCPKPLSHPVLWFMIFKMIIKLTGSFNKVRAVFTGMWTKARMKEYLGAWRDCFL